MKNKIVFLLLLALGTAHAQNGIGYWKDYLPYNDAIALCPLDGAILVATENALFSANRGSGVLQKINTLNGLSDIGISALNSNEELAIIGYKNGNIDLMQGNSIFNLPHLKNETLIGGKQINSVWFASDFAYLSCPFGILQLDLSNKEISNTFYLNAAGNIAVNQVGVYNDSLFSATDSGLYRAALDANLSDFHNWKKVAHIGSLKIKDIGVANNQLYYTTSDSLFRLSKTNAISPINNTSYLEEVGENLYLLTPSKGYLVTENEIVEKHNRDLIRWASDIYSEGDTTWFADKAYGLVKKVVHYWGTQHPTGPKGNNVFNIASSLDYLWIASGGIDSWNNSNVNEGLYWSDGFEWSQLSSEYLGAKDVVSVAINPNQQEEVFVSTWNDGVIQLQWAEANKRFEKTTNYNHLNTNGHLATLAPDTNSGIYGWTRVKCVEFDTEGNLWGANSQVNNPLFVRKNNGEWNSFSFSSTNTTNIHLGDLVIDNTGQKWVIVPGGVGLVVYNDNNTIDDKNDDQDRVIGSALGSGNLPSTSISCLAKDRDGEIWVGTNKGIAVFYSPENVFNGNDFDAQQILVEVDGYVEHLLANETVTAITVDGANRKWLGTQSAGVFLVSPDGTEQIHHFTEDNSPLFSNTITDIAINHNTGEVYIGTSKGLLSYMSDATQGYNTHQNVIVYPNPVRPEYNGSIAVKGLVEDADVKITDLNGTLVHETTALGGQAVWDGRNGYGERVQTGVYLVFSSNKFGTETNVAKILFIH